jgi:hypothetical protein
MSSTGESVKDLPMWVRRGGGDVGSLARQNRGGKLRDKSTINRLKMYRGGKPIRTKDGKVGTANRRDGWDGKARGLG